MSKVKYNDQYSYEIFEDGYDIYNNDSDVAWISQREPYAKLFKYDGTYEENAIEHIKDLLTPPVVPPTDTEKLRADMDFLALMLDMDLPSQEGE